MSRDNVTPLRSDKYSVAIPITNYPYVKFNKDNNPTGLVNHIDNLEFLLECYDITVRYNVISKTEEIIIKGACHGISDNKATQELEFISSLCEINKYPISRLQQQVTTIANANPYNPILEYAQSKPWDGKDRINEVCSTVVTDVEVMAWRNIAVRKMIYSAIAASMNNENHRFSFKGMLVLQGAQGLGKTPWIRLLVGSMVEFFKEGHELDPNKKDSVIEALANWIVELGELDATTKKADVAALKAFLTKYLDEYRKPYAASSSKSPRRTIFIGTVNPSEFLVDTTGNDRFWTVPVVKLLLDSLERIDKQQLWAQALQELRISLKQGVKPWELDDHEKSLMREVNEKFRAFTPIEEKLRDAFEVPMAENQPLKWHGSTMKICTVIAGGNVSAKERAIAKQWLTKHFGEERKVRGVTGFSIPQPSIVCDGDHYFAGFYKFADKE